jgi:hypothetical protein
MEAPPVVIEDLVEAVKHIRLVIVPSLKSIGYSVLDSGWYWIAVEAGRITTSEIVAFIFSKYDSAKGSVQSMRKQRGPECLLRLRCPTGISHLGAVLCTCRRGELGNHQHRSTLRRNSWVRARSSPNGLESIY